MAEGVPTDLVFDWEDDPVHQFQRFQVLQQATRSDGDRTMGAEMGTPEMGTPDVGVSPSRARCQT